MRARMGLTLACLVLGACAGQDEDLVIPTAPECPEASTCGAVDGGGGAGGAGGGGGTAGTGGIVGCSKESVTPAAYTVMNTSGVLDFDLYWVDFTCTEQLSATIPAKGQTSGATYVTHVWRVKNKNDGVVVKEFVIQPGTNLVTVP